MSHSNIIKCAKKKEKAKGQTSYRADGKTIFGAD